ncbi:hypothetical protein [Natronomonas sp. LN261]|jgi:hypothetical protein|uniref:hypothetical protein n=1 Tax=Natronomonas sp. LN261 TaxID=2750669 RepID=UPI0015EEA9B9|nr:hypothetical protein [Natronomonas sp. LN261]
MIRKHIQHIHRRIDAQPLSIRGAITLTAVLSLPVFGTGVRTLGSAVGLGRLVFPLLILAHVPAVIALIAVWSIGCDICRTEGSA